MLQFFSIPFNGTSTTQLACNYGLTGTVVATEWICNSNTTLNFGGDVYTIVSQSTTNLVLQYGSTNSPGTAGTIYYLHKTR